MTVDQIGKYQVLRTLGAGAHSTILHVRRAADSREYALKLVPIESKDDQKFLEQARHEFRVARLLNHSCLIKIYCLETRKNWLRRIKRAELLIEYVNGKTIDAALPLPMSALTLAFLKVASGMMHMHRRGIFHADMKPNNILYGKKGEVKIIDYGLAWIKSEPKDRFQGTPEYMAPETVRNRVINEQTEIYNFGATLYRLATGKLPVNLISVPESARVNEKTWGSLFKPVHELNPATPPALCDLIHRCMAFTPRKRPERMSGVRDELREIASGLGAVVGDGTDAGS